MGYTTNYVDPYVIHKKDIVKETAHPNTPRKRKNYTRKRDDAEVGPKASWEPTTGTQPKRGAKNGNVQHRKTVPN